MEVGPGRVSHVFFSFWHVGVHSAASVLIFTCRSSAPVIPSRTPADAERATDSGTRYIDGLRKCTLFKSRECKYPSTLELELQETEEEGRDREPALAWTGVRSHGE